jgi:integral membrane protein
MLGMPHGLFFMAYLLMAVYLKPQYNWNTLSFIIMLAASVIPFGTFYVDWKLLR